MQVGFGGFGRVRKLPRHHAVEVLQVHAQFLQHHPYCVATRAVDAVHHHAQFRGAYGFDIDQLQDALNMNFISVVAPRNVTCRYGARTILTGIFQLNFEALNNFIGLFHLGRGAGSVKAFESIPLNWIMAGRGNQRAVGRGVQHHHANGWRHGHAKISHATTR